MLLGLTAHCASEVAHFLGEQLRLFECREMTAARGFVPVNELGKELFGPGARRRKDFAREDANADRKIDDAGILGFAQAGVFGIMRADDAAESVSQ